MRLLTILLILASLAATTPEQHLGHPVGADFKLPAWTEVSAYYRKLATETPNLRLSAEGKTTQGRDFLVATISSQKNLDNLPHLKSLAKIIADPRNSTPEQREAALRDGKVFLVITPAMHSTEVAATQFAMQFAHDLATSNEEPWRSARENAVIILPPNLNPDGLDEVASWYLKTVSTPHEGADLLRLYQPYTGHDNNRDWFLLTQPETRIMSRLLYKEWRPQIVWDVHQQGGGAERLFVPPYRDPLNPNLDPSIVAATNLIGARATLDMTRQGLTGVASGVTYDMWWTGGNRSVPVRHNMIGILTEAASSNLASPVFLKPSALRPVHGKEHGPSNAYVSPWPGGWWRVADIIHYELAFGRSLLSSINREPRTWLQNTLDANTRTITQARESGPRVWILPADQRDPSATRRLAAALLETGIELHVTTSPVTADDRPYPAGSIVIRRDQPWSNHVKDLFEIQRYPKSSEPYDVAGWTLPLLLGVHRVEVMQSVDDWPLNPVETPKAACANLKPDPRLASLPAGTLNTADSSSWTQLVDQLQKTQAFSLNSDGFLIPGTPSTTRPSRIAVSRLPRIGIYSPWTGNADEGWLRWIFDTWKIPYVTVRNEQLRAGRLEDFLDVLIIPSTSPATLDTGREPGSLPDQYTRGLSPEGALAIQSFVQSSGGTLITFASASKWAIDLFELPLTDVAASSSSSTTQPATTPDPTKFSCPGSVLRSIATPHPLTAGLPDSLPLFFANSSAWKTGTVPTGSNLTYEVLLKYASTELLLSGYINRPQTISNQAAWVRATAGKGRLHLFAFQPHYRSWSQATFPLLFRAIFLDNPR